MFSGVNIPLAWGATAITQNIIAFMDMPAKSSVLGGSSSGGQIGAWRFSKDSATNDVILNSLGYKSDTTNRRYLKGNTVTHQFKFNCLWKNTGDTGYKAFRATGYSEGAGKYYLIQAKINGSAGGQPTLDGTNARRHQRSTAPTFDDTNVVDFRFASDTKAQQADVTNCTDLKTSLESEISFYTASDLPAAATDIPIPTY